MAFSINPDAALLIREHIPFVVGDTARTMKTRWWKGAAKATITAKLKIAAAKPVFVLFKCRQSSVGWCPHICFAPTKRAAFKAVVQFVDDNHWRPEAISGKNKHPGHSSELLRQL